MHDFDYEALKSEGEDDIGSDYVFLIFSQFSQIFSHERNWHKKSRANVQKFDSWMTKFTVIHKKAIWHLAISSFKNWSFSELL